MAEDKIGSISYHAGWILGVLSVLYHLVFAAGVGRGIYDATRVTPLNLLEISLLLLVFSTARHAYQTG